MNNTSLYQTHRLLLDLDLETQGNGSSQGGADDSVVATPPPTPVEEAGSVDNTKTLTVDWDAEARSGKVQSTSNRNQQKPVYANESVLEREQREEAARVKSELDSEETTTDNEELNSKTGKVDGKKVESKVQTGEEVKSGWPFESLGYQFQT